MSTQIKKDPVFVVVQLSGGNDFMNAVIPVSYTQLTLPTILLV